MIEYERTDDCYGCDNCRNCGRKAKTAHLYDLICDKCNNSAEVLYDANGEQLCAECILQDYEEINDETFEDFI